MSKLALIQIRFALFAASCFTAFSVGLPCTAQERTLWKPVHKSGFREVSTPIISQTSSEIVGPTTKALLPTRSTGFRSSLPVESFLAPHDAFENSFLDAPSGAIETTSDEFDYWLVDARKAPVEGDLTCGIKKLRYWHFSSCKWTEYCEADFLMAMDPSLPTMFFVHGYGLGAPAAAFSTLRLANHISPSSRKFRVVTWAWGSRHNILESPWENIQDKSWKSEVQGFYLAHILGHICPDTQVALVGHSFGCRAVCAALQGLASGTICREPVTREHTNTHPYEAVLIAAGIESKALAPGNRYCKALSQVHRFSISTNCNDRVLNVLSLVTSNPNVMGLTGPDMTYIPPDEALKIKVHDVSWDVWGAHRLGRYTWTKNTIPALQPSIFGPYPTESTNWLFPWLNP